MIFYFVAWKFTIKPPFERACLTFFQAPLAIQEFPDVSKRDLKLAGCVYFFRATKSGSITIKPSSRMLLLEEILHHLTWIISDVYPFFIGFHYIYIYIYYLYILYNIYIYIYTLGAGGSPGTPAPRGFIYMKLGWGWGGVGWGW